MSDGVRYQIANSSPNPLGFMEVGKTAHTWVEPGSAANLVLSEAEGGAAEATYGDDDRVDLVRIDKRKATKATLTSTSAPEALALPDNAVVLLPDAVFKLVFDEVTGEPLGVALATEDDGRVYALDSDDVDNLSVLLSAAQATADGGDVADVDPADKYAGFNPDDMGEEELRAFILSATGKSAHHAAKEATLREKAKAIIAGEAGDEDEAV